MHGTPPRRILLRVATRKDGGMSDKKHVGWLYEQLPGLVGKGVLPAETAERLRQHYGKIEGGGRRLAVIVFGILGAALIGGGVILLLAHNWEELSRPVRAVISFLPLLLAQALAGYVVWKRRDSTVWCEGAGTFWALAIGATISLVAQTYNISGDFAAFVLTWSLAGLPVVYLLNSSVAAALYWIGITAWVGNVHWMHGQELWFWPLTALALPHLWMVGRENRYRQQVGLLLAVLAICAAFGIGFNLDRLHGDVWIPVFTSYFAALYMIGELWFDEGHTMRQRPLQSIGGIGAIVLATALTFRETWEHLMRHADWLALLHSPLVIWPFIALALWVYTLTRRNVVAALFGGLPVVSFIGTTLTGVAVLVLMNLYMLGLGVALIALGVRDRRLGVVNLGLLVVATLVIARFFDADMSFVVRGLAFIAVGVGFLVTNVLLIKRTRGAQ
jgi:uncharacterized membrane protein